MHKYFEDMFDRPLKRLEKSIRQYIATSGDFKFISPEDVHFEYDAEHNVFCCIDKECIEQAIPEDQFDEWVQNVSEKLDQMFDNVNLKSKHVQLVFNAADGEWFIKMMDNELVMTKIAEEIAAILETIDGAVIDDWGDDGEEVDSPYYV